MGAIYLNGISYGGGGGSGGTTTYNQLPDKPQINSVELSGDKSAEDLGLADADDVLLKDGSVAASNLTIGARISESTKGNGSFTNGFDLIASGFSSHSEGVQNTASGPYSHAEGQHTTASGSLSHAEGYETVSSGAGSHSEGFGTVSGYEYQHVSGKYNDNKSTTLFEVGNGTSTSARSNAFEVYTDGHVNINGDIYRNGSDAMGTANGLATLDNTGKVPSSQLPSYVDDVIEGYYDSVSDKFYEDSQGTIEIPGERGKIYVDVGTNKAYRWTGSVFFCINDEQEITVDNAMSNTSENPVQNKVITAALANKVDKVNGKGLSTNDFDNGYMDKLSYLAEIYDVGNGLVLTEQGELYSSLPGKKLQAEMVRPVPGDPIEADTGAEIFNDYRDRTFNGTSASAGNVASGEYSLAEGALTTAMGNYAHAEGYCTMAGHNYQHVSGKYNDNKTNTLLEVGNGTSSNDKSNAFEVYADGHINVNGDIYQNGSKKIFPQVSTLSIASATESGNVYQYVGTTAANYTHGHFYECVSSGSDNYEWQELDLGGGVPAGGTAGQMLIKDSSTDGDASWQSLDSSPTQNSTKPATSGGIYTALSSKTTITTTTTDPGEGVPLATNNIIVVVEE